MGCVDTITFEHFPKQSNHLGQIVEVCYHFDATKRHRGTIVRDDTEQPFETIIRLENGHFVRAVECQYSFVRENKS